MSVVFVCVNTLAGEACDVFVGAAGGEEGLRVFGWMNKVAPC